MLFISMDDFFSQVKTVSPLAWEEEQDLARQIAAGDETARKTLVRSHLPLVAAVIRRAPAEIRPLRTVYACIAAVEKSVDTFHFHRDGKAFAHHLNRYLRQCITQCIANRP